MFARVHCPQSLSLDELDHFLEQGHFRMGQTVFTTNFLNFKSQLYTAIWLRVVLSESFEDTTFRRLMKQNGVFRTEFYPAFINPQKEALFGKYKQAIDFEASTSLKQLLFGTSSQSVFNTLEINLFDGDRLIAIGFFDIGKKSAAGISSFYDPAYKKYSLGKYLIYLKMQYCKELGLQYFYPGYFVPGYPSFNYKLQLGKPALQYWQLTSRQWLPIAYLSRKDNLLEVMNDKLCVLQRLLETTLIESKVLKYEFFDANLLAELTVFELFDFPLFLYFHDLAYDTISPIVVFDVNDQQYHLIQCRSVWISNTPNANADFYSTHLLKKDHDLFKTENPDEIVEKILVSIN